MDNDDTPIDATSASGLLAFEQAEFERLLHDELGQSLVAIRSMAIALTEADDESRREIAALIEQTADHAYAGVYDLMLELRAEGSLQTREFAEALQHTVEDARLGARDFTHRIRIDNDALLHSNQLIEGLLLRSTRILLNAVRRCCLDGGGQVEIDVDADIDPAAVRLQFGLVDAPSAKTLMQYPRLTQLEARIAAFGGNLERVAIDSTACRLYLTLPYRISTHG